MKAYVHTKMYTNVHSFFFLKKNSQKLGNNPNFRQSGKRINEMWYMHMCNIEYYSQIERNEVLIYVTTWINFKIEWKVSKVKNNIV